MKNYNNWEEEFRDRFNVHDIVGTESNSEKYEKQKVIEALNKRNDRIVEYIENLLGDRRIVAYPELGIVKTCKICGNPTEAIFNINFKRVHICDDCSCRIVKQEIISKFN